MIFKCSVLRPQRILNTLVLLLSMICVSAQAESADKSIESLTERGVLRIGLDIPYGVMEFYDKSGNPAGIDVDIARAISEHLGTDVSFHAMPFADLFEALKSNRVDLLVSAVTITPERQKSMRFSTPYMDVGLSLGVRESNNDIFSVEDLNNKRIGVLRGTTGEKFAREKFEGTSTAIQLFDNNEKRLDALRSGEIDAAIVHFLTTSIAGVKIVGKPLSQSYYGVVARLTDEALMREVNRTVRNLKRSGALDKIKKKYTD